MSQHGSEHPSPSVSGAASPSGSASASRLGRRSLLKAAGAGALAATVATVAAATPGVAAPSVTRSGDGDGSVDRTWDAIVVGAGYAGGTVARELSARGLSTLVLEARDRIGGRVWTSSFAGERVELGGGWFGPGQELVARELARYSIATTHDVTATRAVMPDVHGFRSHDPAAAFGRLGTLFDRYYEGSAAYFERPLEPLYRKDLLQQVDGLSLADRLAQLDLPAVDHKWVSGATSVFAGGNTVGGLTGLAQWFQLAGGTYDGFLSTMSLRPDGGMISVLQAMFRESGAVVRHGSPVTGISEANGIVSVRVSSGQVHRAPVVVVATPVNTWRHIDFRPGLPKVHADAAVEGIGVPHATKLFLHLRGTTEPVYAQAPEGAPILLMLPQQELPDGRLYVAFTGPALDVTNPVAVRAAVRELVPEATVVNHRAMEWTKDRYARGGWGLRRPGQLLRQLPAIQQPHGRIVFAGGDIASGWYGAFVEGAIESGFRAADQATALAAR
ncbi:flavin monoamine oxidase family protein [Streptomyces sp. NPDC047928]|uniref:flavin monoamine oxidase family protein n=1 Tax=unclassified Streptomyces TaxID=2593676 RepID=UPI0037154BE2